MKKPKKKVKKFKKNTNYDNVKLLLEEFKMPFEEGVNDKVHPYIFISFDLKGKAVTPYQDFQDYHLYIHMQDRHIDSSIHCLTR